MSGIFRALWRHSALPILLVVAALAGLGTYLQLVAVRLQSRPLVIEVRPEAAPGGPGFDAALERLPEGGEPEADPGRALPREAEAVLVSLRAGRTEEGLAALRAFRQKDPRAAGDPQVALAEARALSEAGRHEEALAVLDGVRSPAGFEAELAFRRGLVLERLDRLEPAEAEYRRALGLRGTWFEASFNLGSLLLAEGKNADAVSVLTSALPLAGGEHRSRALFNLAVACTRGGMFARAEQAYIEAINLVPQNLKARVGLAQLYREHLDRPEDALRVYQEALRLDERYAPAMTGLARLKQQQGRTAEALSLLEQAVAYDPAYEEGRRALALLLFDQGQVERAREELTWITRNGRDAAGAWFSLGRIEFAERAYARAVEAYRRSLEVSGGRDPETLNNLGLALKAAGDPKGAEEAFLEAVRADPGYATGQYNLGLLYLEAEDDSRARASFERAVEARPDYAEAWYNLGLVCARDEEPYRAIEAYEQALRLQPANLKARLNLAVQYRKTGATPRAVEQYRLLLSLNPTYATAWYNLGLALKDLDQAAPAETAYRKAVELEPEEPRYWYNLALLVSGDGRPEEAERILAEALEVHPQAANLRYLRAQQLGKLGRAEETLRELERTVAVSPDYVRAWVALGDLRSDRGEPAQAAAALEQALQLDGRDSYTRYSLAKEYYRLGRYEEAVGEYRRSLEDIRDNAWIWYHLGKSLQALGREDEARTAWNRSLALDPGMGRYVFQRVGEVEDSVQMLRRMLEEDPDNGSLRLQLAEQLARAGGRSEARGVLEELIRREPANAAARVSLAGLLADAEDYSGAESVLEEARRLFPARGEVSLAYARALIRQDKRREAVVPLRAAATGLAEPLEAWTLLGETLYELREYDESAAAFRQAVRLAPADGNAALDLGKAYYRGKSYEQALAEFGRARQMLPNYGWADIWYGRALARLDRPGEAETAYRTSITREPGFVQGYISLGDLTAALGRTGEAIGYYRRALELDPLHPSARDKLDRLQGR